jgi:hypothetical protein
VQGQTIGAEQGDVQVDVLLAHCESQLTFATLRFEFHEMLNF